jgi:hypothetical protein
MFTKTSALMNINSIIDQIVISVLSLKKLLIKSIYHHPGSFELPGWSRKVKTRRNPLSYLTSWQMPQKRNLFLKNLLSIYLLLLNHLVPKQFCDIFGQVSRSVSLPAEIN